MSKPTPKPHRKPEPGDGAALMRVIERYNLLLGANAIEWRPCGDVDGVGGSIPSLNIECRLVATDGIAAWAILPDGRPFYCHLAAFEAQRSDKCEATASAPRKSKRQQLLDSI